ncbi:glycoside hydrolase family 3 C-terminal domain-containing protein [Nonomuraea dietziae]|uniref:glycoside hydrolase family 3 C-terminal domain-containing protein n=1 Tax=Nonomuraea dietziae TaxID=65515 RepID=UPI00340A186C
MNEPFRDPAHPTAHRVADLLGRLTLEEKLSLLHQHQPAVPRLGVKAFRTGTEALHGLAWLGPATVFPQAVGLASTWDPELVERVGAATADEVLASHRKDPAGAGRNVWAPVVNPLRDPRWGRNEEGYSEDPWLTGLLATAYATGLRGRGPVLRTAPTLKHFLGYNNETDRCVTSSNLPPRVLHEYELPAFLPPLQAAVAVMPSYNLVNGRPAHLSPLINDVLRAAAPDELLVVSDAYAPGNLYGLQAYHPDAPTAYAAAVKAGLDSFTQDDDRPADTLAHLRTALERGLLDEQDIDRAAGHVLSIRVRLGEFDGEEAAEQGESAPYTPGQHQDLAREAAARSIVLLKNEGLLPLRAPLKVAVIGQLADTLMEDWYSGTLPYAVTALQGMAERCETVFCEGVDRVALGGHEFDVFDWGGGALALRSPLNGQFLSADEEGRLACDQPGPNGWEVRQTFRRADGALRHLHSGRYVAEEDGRLVLADEPAALSWELLSSGARQAAELAATADVAVVVAGDHPLVNGRETEDRTDLDLPAAQEAVLRAVHAANSATVLVLSSGYPFGVTWADEHVPAVLWSSHGGQEYGHALAEVLFGDRDPEGRLTQTWYRDACELPDLLDYDIIASDATYLYYRGAPLYPFGHGLSYTGFAYTDLTMDGARAEVTVTNTGEREGVEVVQFYTHQRRSRVKQPLRRLRGFERVRLAPGQSARVSFELDRRDLAFWDVTRGRLVVEEATHLLMAGRSARDLRLCAAFDVEGERIPPRDPGELRAVDHDEYDAITFTDRDTVRGEAPGAWILYRQVAFAAHDSCVITAASAGGAMLTLRLGDPLSGQVLATVPVPGPGELAETRCDLASTAGVHDLYVVFENEGVTLSGMRFA